MAHAESLQRILAEPLSYLHPQRLSLPSQFDGAEARSLLDRMLLEGLDLQGPWPATPLSAMGNLWIGHWRELPYIARLIGAYCLMPDLAQGAALLRLPLSLRRFAGYRLGTRRGASIEGSSDPLEQVEAAGLNALWSWREQVPPMLLERLILQFSEPVVGLSRQWPITEPDPALFFLAVQHARRYPNPD